MKIEVYSRKEDQAAGVPKCMQCDMTVKRLEAEGIEFDVIDVEKDPEAKARLEARGIRQVPVVFVDGEVKTFDGQPWMGFRPDMIAKMKAEIEASATPAPGM